MIYKVNNIEKWMEISEKLWSLMDKDIGTTRYLFDVLTDSTGQHFIHLDLDLFCPIYLTAQSEQTMSELGAALELTQADGARIKDYILNNNPIQLKHIIPSNLEPYNPIFNVL